MAPEYHLTCQGTKVNCGLKLKISSDDPNQVKIYCELCQQELFPPKASGAVPQSDEQSIGNGQEIKTMEEGDLGEEFLCSPENIEEMNNFPFPIAFHYRRVATEHSPLPMLTAVFATFENTVAYCVLVLLSLYYGKKSDDSRRLFESAVQLDYPDMNRWLQFLQEMHKSIKERGGSALHKLFAQWYEDVEVKKTACYYGKQKPEIGHLTALLKFRKEIFPLLKGITVKELQNYVNYALPLLEKILDKLRFLYLYPLIYVDSTSPEQQKVNVVTLVGADASFEKMTLTSSQRLPTGHVMLKEHDTFHSLYPFVLYQPCYECVREREKSKAWEVLFFHGQNLDCQYYGGVFHEIVLKVHQKFYLELQAMKRKEVVPPEPLKSLENIREIVHRATQKQINEMEAAKIIKNYYYPRRQAEHVLDVWVHKSPFPVLVLKGGKGTGKTTLLATMAHQWMAEKKIVFFLRLFGDRGLNLGNDIAQLLGSKEPWKEIKTLSQEASEKWIFILDGVENSSNPAACFQSLTTFVRQHKNFVKILVSLQDFSYYCWEKLLPKDMLMPVEGFSPSVGYTQSFYHLSNFSKLESEEANPGGGDYSLLSRKIQGMLRSPALVQIILDLGINTIPTHMGVRQLLAKFIEQYLGPSRIRQNYLNRFIQAKMSSRLGCVCIDQIIKGDDAAFDKDTLGFTDSLGHREVIHQGILERIVYPMAQGNNIAFHFPSSILGDYLQYRAMLLEKKLDDDEMLVTYLREIAQGNYNLWGPVYWAIVRLADEQQLQRLTMILKRAATVSSESVYVVISQIVYEMLVLKEETASQGIGENGPIDALVKALMEVASPEILDALARFAIYLYGDDKFLVAAQLMEQLAAKGKIGESCVSLDIFIFLAAYSYQKLGDTLRARKLYKDLQHMIARGDNTHLYASIGSSLLELGDFEMAEDFFREAIKSAWTALDSKAKGEAYHKLSLALAQRKDFPAARQALEESKNIYTLLKDADRLAQIKNSEGFLFQLEGHLNEALASYEESAAIAEKARALYPLGTAFYNIGTIHRYKENLAKALQYFQKSAEIQSSAYDLKPLATTYNSMAIIYELQGHLQQAREYLNRENEALEKLGDKQRLAASYDSLAMFYYNHEDRVASLCYLHKALRTYDYIKDAHMVQLMQERINYLKSQ